MREFDEEMAVLRNLAPNRRPLCLEDLGIDPKTSVDRCRVQRELVKPILRRLSERGLATSTKKAQTPRISGDPREGWVLTDAGRDMLLVREVMES